MPSLLPNGLSGSIAGVPSKFNTMGSRSTGNTGNDNFGGNGGPINGVSSSSGPNGAPNGALRVMSDPDSFRALEIIPVSIALVRRNMWMFICLKTLGSFDSGAFSAAIGAANGIAENWELSSSQQGVLTSSVFLGNTLGCVAAGSMFTRYSAKNLLTGALILHTIFTFFFTAVPNYYAALFFRFVVGITLAFIVVYTPVWVDEFAPKDRASMWQAWHNAGVPLGIMMGYICGAFIPSYTGYNWEWAFYIKCIVMIPAIVYVVKVDRRSINRRQKEDQHDPAHSLEMSSSRVVAAPGGPLQNRSQNATTPNMNSGFSLGDDVNRGSPQMQSFAGVRSTAPPTAFGGADASNNNPVSDAFGAPIHGDQPTFTSAEQVLHAIRFNLAQMWISWSQLMKNGVYMCSVLAMSSLYFVVTGLQNFVTQYLRDEPFNASMKTIMIGFGCAVVTAPVFGVITGGILLDKIGGYHNNTRRCAWFGFGWGVAAAGFSILCIFMETTLTFLIVISIVLFCGGAIIPPGSGLVISSLPDRLRPTGAAFSQMAYNLLGNFSGPMVCGYVAEWTGELQWGIYTVFMFSVVGLVPLSVLLFLSNRVTEAHARVRRPQRGPQRVGTASLNLINAKGESVSIGALAASRRGPNTKIESPRHDQEEMTDVLFLSRTSVPEHGNSNTAGAVDHSTIVGNRMGEDGLHSVPSSVVPPRGSTLKMSDSREESLPGQPEENLTSQMSLGRVSMLATRSEGSAHVGVPIDDDLDDHYVAPSRGGNGSFTSPVTEENVNALPSDEAMLAEDDYTIEEALEEIELNQSMLALEGDASLMLQYPNQMSFGMDMVRSWLMMNAQRSRDAMNDSLSMATFAPNTSTGREERAQGNRSFSGNQRVPLAASLPPPPLHISVPSGSNMEREPSLSVSHSATLPTTHGPIPTFGRAGSEDNLAASASQSNVGAPNLIYRPSQQPKKKP